MSNNYLSTDAYKGVRDFYPKDMAVLSYIKGVWKTVAEKYGYVAYDASPLESTELYTAKSGEEIVNEQTYSFIDRGEREVTLRPEMTPTVARMIAGKHRDIPFPARWYSIPNLFRYERPQRGRLREHWQLNVDIFGHAGIEAEQELLMMAYDIMSEFGIPENKFVIKLNSRKASHAFLEAQGATEEQIHRIIKLLDRKHKIDDFDAQLTAIHGTISLDFPEPAVVTDLKTKLAVLGITNVEFDPTLMRGFDYYTDVVFEVFNTDPQNKRALFGGGRYDGLCDLFGVPNIPAAGFGMGDVTMRDVLETYNIVPDYTPATMAHVCVMDSQLQAHAIELAQNLRESGCAVSIDYSGKKLGDQLKYAERLSVPHAIIVGADEVASGMYQVKTLANRLEKAMNFEDMVSFFLSK